MFSLSAYKAGLTSLQKEGKVLWHLTYNCRLGPSTTVLAHHCACSAVLIPPACLQNGGWSQYLPRVSRHQGLSPSSFRLLLSHLLSSIWKPCTQGVAGSPSVVFLSSCLQPHIPTCPRWPTGKEEDLVIKASLLVWDLMCWSRVRAGKLFLFRPRSRHLHPKLWPPAEHKWVTSRVKPIFIARLNWAKRDGREGGGGGSHY